MKKIFIIVSIVIFFFSCSQQNEKARFEFSKINTSFDKDAD